MSDESLVEKSLLKTPINEQRFRDPKSKSFYDQFSISFALVKQL